jgi:N-acetylmuramic acid 6-phosphate etherase
LPLPLEIWYHTPNLSGGPLLKDSKAVFDELLDLVTEQRNPRSRNLDRLDTKAILRLINSEDRAVPQAVAREIPKITQAVELIVSAFKHGGRLFYVGAGTSGRLGVLDAAECPPTYGTDPQLVQGIIAGGLKARVRSQEGSEDRREEGRQAIRKHGVTGKDVVCGIAASRRTPFVLAALEEAKRTGARTIYLTCNPRAKAPIPRVDVLIAPVVGPEVVTGSTRMKAGTATKLVLNMMTTAAMVRMGKTYGNLMVDLRATSQKLVERSKRVIMTVTGCDYETAERLLNQAKGHVKTAIVMCKTGCSCPEAQRRLTKAKGFVSKAVAKRDR